MTVPWQAPAELERRITRLEIQLSQLHDMVRAINQRTRPPTPPMQPHPDFDQEYQGYWKTEDDLK